MFSLFKNNQRWLVNSIPNRKIEMPDLMRDVLYKMIVHFVEVDNGIDNNIWEDDEGHKSILKRIEDVYYWIKEERPILDNKLNQMWSNFPDVPEEQGLDKFMIEHSLDDILSLQDHMWDRDQKSMKEIIEVRDSLIII